MPSDPMILPEEEFAVTGSGNHEVVDISSDEEVQSRADVDYLSWLNDVMEAVDEKSDSTDVVEFVSEVKGSVDSHYRNSVQAVDDDDDDDDCVILDDDPDKTAKTAEVDHGDTKLSKNDDDDVLVVGQKGEIACRDFPHPRHSCAKFPFNSTSHDKFCDMCHCYVCDIPAPCPYWCIGVSTVDHCHANDKEKIWKNQREYSRTGNMPTTQPSPNPTPPLPPSFTLTRSPTPNIIRLSQNIAPRNQLGIRPCSSAVRVAHQSNARARSRIKQPVPHNPNHGLQNRPVQSFSSVRNNVIQKDRSSCMGKLRSRVASSGTRYGAANGNTINAGLYRNVQGSQSTHHSSSVVPPAINRDLYTQQQCKYQASVTDRCSAVPGSQSNVHIRHSGQNISSRVDRQLEKTADPFAPLETPLTDGDSQTATVEQQPRSNENVLQTKLSEFESWLMESSNQSGVVSPLAEAVGQDYVSSVTFDFETFLND